MHPGASSPRARLTFALMTFLLLGLPVQVWSDDGVLARATLKGITAIRVAVEKLPPEAERDGLTRDQLQTDVEARLRKAGIKVTSTSVENKVSPYLHLNVSTVKNPPGFYAFNIRLEFNQGVILERNRNVLVPAPTWSIDFLGTVGAQRLRDVRSTVAAGLDKFINAYLEQNPKP